MPAGGQGSVLAPPKCLKTEASPRPRFWRNLEVWSIGHSIESITCGSEVVLTFLWIEEATHLSDGLPELVDGPDGSRPKKGLELGEGHLDGVEIGAIGRQEHEPGAFVADRLFGSRALMGGEIVENDDIALVWRGRQLGLDIGLENDPVHRRIDDEGDGQSGAPECGDEGLGFPMAEGSLGVQALPLRAASAQGGHLGGGAGFIDEDQAVRLAAHARPLGEGRIKLNRRQTVVLRRPSRAAAINFIADHSFSRALLLQLAIPEGPRPD